MNDKLKYMFVGFITLFVCSSFVACSDDAEAEIDKWSVNYVYLQRPALGSDEKQFDLTHSFNGVENTAEIIMPITVRLLRPHENDVKVKLGYTINNELPEEVVSFRHNGTVVIPAGEVIVCDTLDITANWNLVGRQEIKCTASVEIESIEPASGWLRKSENQSSLDFIIKKNAYLNMTYSFWYPPGTAISNRSVWKIVIQPEVEAINDPEWLVDNDYFSGISAEIPGFWFTVDLTKTTVVTGFCVEIYPDFFDMMNFAPKAIEVYTSNDGENWESHGVLATPEPQQYITFMSPVTCRYIKYDIVEGSISGHLNLTEFDVYEQ